MSTKSNKGAGKVSDGRKTVVRNRRALRDYFIDDRMEAGMVLVGSEVKSLRDGRANMSDAYAEVRGGELFLINLNISEYPWANLYNHEPRRERKLLMHAREIDRLSVRVNERGYTLVPLEVYFRRGKAKVELGLAKGKRQYDKRETVRERDLKRELEQEMRRR